MIYKATDPIRSLPELLEAFARKIADLERRVADLEKREAADGLKHQKEIT